MTSPEMPIPPGGTQYRVLETPKNGLGVASLVFGILGLVGSFFVIGVLPAILGLILGIIGYRRSKSGEANNGGVAVAGIVTSLLALLIALVIGVLVAVLLTSDEFQDLTECLDDANNEAEAIENCQFIFGEGE